ncbi:uncharacterized protein LOC127149698, partial [Cucumis melo]|uniref:Uncharacterized protein LOC127149698 n=1 Tax=Cucumis melo TaxID=3656 RepID=A0ABM3KUQ5_CUCME
FTTRLLVPTSRIGCLIGKGGAIIIELRRLTKTNIRILSKKNLPQASIALENEMVWVSGDLVVVKEALVHIVTRLIANLFYREVALSAVLLYLPLTTDGSDSLSYDGKEGKRHGRGHSYSSGFGDFNDLAGGDGYESYSGSQIHILTLTCLIIAMGTVEKKPYEDKAVKLKAEYEKAFESQNGKNEDDDKEVEEIGEKEVEEIIEEE